MNNTTLLFLVKKEGEKITEVCLAMKKRGFGTGRYNGTGGKLLPAETIEQAAVRETKEEIDVEAKKLSKVAILDFSFALKPEWNQQVHTYFCTEWEGEPTESEEMKPDWFKIADIPFDRMWPDDTFWLPRVLEGSLVRGAFTFGEGDSILEKSVNTVDSLDEK